MIFSRRRRRHCPSSSSSSASASLRSTSSQPENAGSGRERRSAATGRLGVRIADDELGALEVFAVVDLRAHQVLETHRVDEELHALILDAGVSLLLLLVESEAVLEARTAPSLDENAELEARIVLALNELAHLDRRGIGEE